MHSMADIRRANKAAGRFWFSPDTLRFFKSRIGDTVYEGPGGVFFVSSEKPPHGPRAHTVRQFDPETKSVATVGPFCTSSSYSARGRAALLARGFDVVAKGGD